MRRETNRHGMLLVAVIMAMTLVSILGLAIVSLTTSSSYSRVLLSQSNRAYYLAESGGVYARSLLRTNPAAFPSGTFTLLDGSGSFTLSSSNSPGVTNRVNIVSIGTIGSARRRISFNLPRGTGSGGNWPQGGTPVPGQNVTNSDPGNQSFSSATVDGDLALRVDRERVPTDDFALSPYIHESLLRVSADSFLTGAWETGNHFLSYDVQAKMKIDFRAADRSHFMGISFRLDSQERGYGVSYGRASEYEYSSAGDSYDGIPGEYIPDSVGTFRYWTGFGWRTLTGSHDMTGPIIVLWQNKGDRIPGDSSDDNPQKRWLTYAVIESSDNILKGTASTNQVPKDWSTLMVRVKEAPSLYCSDIRSVRSGNLLSQGGGSATAVVDGTPLRGSGNGGALILSNLIGTFTAGNVSVNGTNTISATTFRAKDNFIWTFMADTAGTSVTGDGLPSNTVRKAYPRGVYNGWGAHPIEAWSADVDNFTLITWDASNAAETEHQLLAGGTVVRTSIFTTPSSGSLNGPEIGLHTLGWFTARAPIGYDLLRYRKDYYFDDLNLWVDPWDIPDPGYQY